MLVETVPSVISGPVLSNMRVRRMGFPGTGGSGESVSCVGRNTEVGSQSLIVAKELIMSVHRVTSFNNILNSI
jgi:hypothetical protein